MTALRTAAATLQILLLLAGPGLAQEQAPPPSPAAPSSAAPLDTAPQTEAPQSEAPLIALPPMPSGPTADPATGAGAGDPAALGAVPGADGAGADEADSGPSLMPIPVERDRGTETGHSQAGWLLHPRPASLLSERVQVGASLRVPGILRLTGELADVELLLDLPSNTPPDAALQFSLRSSVNVLSDLAEMQVKINEAPPIAVKLDQLSGFATITLPTSAWVPGQNRIALSLRQPHRIFCGPDATFGVWTEIALDQSGVRLPELAVPNDATGFAVAALSETAGGRSLTLLAAEDENTELIRALADRLRGALGPLGRVDLRSYYGLGSAPLASVALIASDRVSAGFRRGGNGGIVLQIEHLDGEVPDLTEALAQIEAAALQNDTLPLPPGRATALSALGTPEIIGNTHYFRKDISFALPTDWLLMANQKARLDLHYGFAKGLARGAILLIKVNGETVRLLPLDEAGGAMMPMLPVGFNANLLRPGRNQLSFEMMIPGDPPTEVCPIRRSDLLVILGDSTLLVPPSPAMVLPGVTSVLRRLEPGAVISAEGSADPRGLDVISQRIAGELDPPTNAFNGAVLHVAALSDLALVPLEPSGLTPSLVRNLLFPDAGALAPADSTTEPPPARARRSFTLNDETSLPAAADPADGPGAISSIWQKLTPRKWLQQEFNLLRDSAFLGSTQSLRDWVAGRSGVALLLRPDFAQRGELWLLLGPAADPRATGVALNQLREDGLAQGEAALLNAQGEWQVWSPVRLPVLLEAPTPKSVRTMIGNYASWSPLLFTLTLLVLALLSAIPALLYVLLSRREGNER